MTSAARVAPHVSSLAARLMPGPIAMSPADAARRFGGWLDDLPRAQATAIRAVCDRHPDARALLEATCDHAPYLFDLMRGDPLRLERLLGCDPDAHAAAVIAQAETAVATAHDEAETMRALRLMKAETALLVALCDLGGVWPLSRVTQALTDTANVAVGSALRFLLRHEATRGRIAPADAELPERGSGVSVLAMGKMGAGELNYSSDIDLIVFFDPAATSLAPDIEPQPFFVRIAQGLVRLLQQRTADGYVFRVDLRLRPDPASTPVAISIASAMHYYEREGRTWERAAMIKARPCAGDAALGDELLAQLAPFVWRKHLDFAALADVHDMKRQMQTIRGQSELTVEGHNVKIGRGGIREIEFFAQTQQLIAGGRHPELRVRATDAALDILAASNWITFEARDELKAAYAFLRRVEHRLQMIADEQTHTLPDERDAVERFARFMGCVDRAAFAADLLMQLDRVRGHYARLFEGEPTGTATLPAINYGGGAGDPRLIEHLASLGFQQPANVAKILQQWIGAEYRVLKVESTHRLFLRLAPDLIRQLARAEQPDNAVAAFDRLLQALLRGGRLMSLLDQNREVIALVTMVLGTAPRLGDMMARQPQIIDGLIDPRFFGKLPDRGELSARLAATLADADSYEEFLDRLRMFGQESVFLIGARILSGTVSAQQAGVAFADVAEGIAATVHGLVGRQFAAQHGRIDGQETALIAMGRLGSREMTASSDLDLILIYDFDSETPDSDGERPLQGAQYFARLTQRLISAFTTRTNYGVLYDIDMRLRPSGRAGPLASRLQAFADYQRNDAWTWEHMALTRARVVSASPAFRARIERIVREVLTMPRDASLVASDVAEMRRAVALEKGEADIWDVKHAAGGLIDIDFIAQYLQLAHAAAHPDILDVGTMQALDNAARLGVLAMADAEILRRAARLYHDLNQILRLCVSERFRPQTAGADLLQALAQAGDAPDFSALEARLRETQSEVRPVFDRLLK